MAAKKKTATLIPVIACSPTRDVWYGHTPDPDATPLVLHSARHCYAWDTTEGIGQLATRGPGARAKIGTIVAEKRMRAVAGVLLVTPEAVAAFAGATWSR